MPAVVSGEDLHLPHLARAIACADVREFSIRRGDQEAFRTVNAPPEDARPFWDIAPSQPALVVRRHPETGARHLDLLQWGLVPHWTKDLTAARRPANARAETIATAATFRSAFAPGGAWCRRTPGTSGRRPPPASSPMLSRGPTANSSR